MLPLLAALLLPATQSPPADLRYAGTVGQQRVTLRLQVEADAIRGGGYTWASQKGEVRIVDSRQFGTTVVLQDEDGNILHLHFEDAAGGKAGSFDAAAMLEGTMDRAEQDLPVRLTRQPR